MGEDAKPETQATPEIRPYGFWQSVSFLSERAVIRGLRIACGAAVFLFARSVLDDARDTLGKRFADLSPLELGSGLLGAAVGIGIVFLALYIAFGPGKSLAVEKRKWRDAMELEEYCKMILERIRQNWSPPANVRIPTYLILDAYQNPNGEIRQIDTRGLNKHVELKESLEAAIRETLPVPRPPYNSRSKHHIEITFYPTDTEERGAEVRAW